MDCKEAIEIPFGAKDSELKGWEYTIPEGYKARIDGNKIILEPKESEDEGIRREIITYLKLRREESVIKDPYIKWIAWLEKQNKNVLKEAFDKSEKDYPIEDKKEAIEYSDSILPTSVVYGESEEEYMLHTIMEAAFMAGQKKSYPNQNPAWSEEDEERLNSIIESYKYLLRDYKACHDVDYIPYNSDTVIRNVVDDVNFLKSLKERYTWKPSDGQMALLREVQQALLGKDCHNRFVNFMCDLKKLKG